MHPLSQSLMIDSHGHQKGSKNASLGFCIMRVNEKGGGHSEVSVMIDYTSRYILLNISLNTAQRQRWMNTTETYLGGFGVSVEPSVTSMEQYNKNKEDPSIISTYNTSQSTIF